MLDVIAKLSESKSLLGRLQLKKIRFLKGGVWKLQILLTNSSKEDPKLDWAGEGLTNSEHMLG
jgi:hypothetical protein